ncbi:MAG: hypothetical protein ACK46X_21670, partial [Candidatus Sericytochromatia bacterium]
MFFRERLKAKTTPLEQPQTVTLTTSTTPPQRPAAPEVRKVDPHQALKTKIHRRLVEEMKATPIGADEDIRGHVREGVDATLAEL